MSNPWRGAGSIVIRAAAEVVPFSGRGPVRGDGFERLERLARADVGMEDGLLRNIGDAARADVEIDARGCTVIPGFVDCHTHLPFVGWRADEDAARLTGASYEAIHGRRGGIYRSAAMLAEASDEEVTEFARRAATAMLASGTTTFEAKSGYGLGVAAELRQLDIANSLADGVEQRVVVTCLAAHAVPDGYSAGEWIAVAADELLPAVAQGRLARACDLYVESIAFGLEHAARLAHSAQDLGLALRVHADQLADNQTGSFAARWGFATADHLNHTSIAAAGDLAESDTIAVLLPAATFTLRQSAKPPARDLIGMGAAVALGTDLNPGTSPVHSMPFVIALSCRLYGLRPLEALAAATVNSACALGLDGSAGRLCPGDPADAVVLGVPTADHIAYRPEFNPVLAVVCGGRLVYVADDFGERVKVR